MMIQAMFPTAALLAFGLLLKLHFNFGDEFWRGAERLTYFILLPALFINSLAKAQFDEFAVGRMALVVACASVASGIMGLAVRPISGTNGAGFTSVFQGFVRFNNYIGATIAGALFGIEGLALAALCNAILIPLGNIFSTLALARWGTANVSGWGIVRAVLSNPLVMACFIGLSLNALGNWSPLIPLLDGIVVKTLLGTVSTGLALIGQAALPIGLLCVGAGLSRAAGNLRGYTQPLLVATIGRLVLVPAMAFGLACLLGLSGHAAIITVLFLALPTASSCYILARQLGGDAPLAAAVVATQTTAAMITLPLWIWLATSFF